MPRTRLLAVMFAICLVVAFIYLGTYYIKQRQEQSSLSTQLESTGQILALLPEPSANLTQRLTDAQQALEATEKNFSPQQINTTKVSETLLLLSDKHHLKIVPFNAGPWVESSTAGHSYSIFRLSLNIEGNLSDLIAFMDEIVNSQIAMVTHINLNPGESGSISGTATPVKATVDLALVAQSEGGQ